MKHLVLSALIATGFTAKAAEINYVGQFSMPHKTFIYGYDNKKSCEADKGEWLTEDEICTFDASDDVKVQASEEGLKISVDTIGSNAHMCGFESIAVQKSLNEIVGSAETEVYRYNEVTKESEWVKAVCEVTVTYKDSDTVSVSNNGNCQEFCGARAQLHIEEAKRAAPKAE